MKLWVKVSPLIPSQEGSLLCNWPLKRGVFYVTPLLRGAGGVRAGMCDFCDIAEMARNGGFYLESKRSLKNKVTLSK